MDKTVDQLYTDLIAMVKLATGETKVIRGDSNGPQPKDQYASILHTAQHQVGLDSVQFLRKELALFGFDGNGEGFDQVAFSGEEDPKLQEFISGLVEHTFSLQFYRGTSPADQARKMFRFSQTSAGSEFLFSNALALKQVGDPIDTKYQVAEKWISRYSMDIVVITSSELLTELDSIGEATININQDTEEFTVQT